MLARVHSAQVIGLKTDLIDVEVDLSRGLHSFVVVGLPDKAVEESRDRISAAIKNSGFSSPQKSNKRVVISLAPADIKKEGPVFDLAIAIAYLAAAQEIRFPAAEKLFFGELALDGTIRPVRGALLITEAAKRAGFKEIYLPEANAKEAALIHDIAVFSCRRLKDIARHLTPPPSSSEETRETTIFRLTLQPPTEVPREAEPESGHSIDLSDIKGQPTAKRGLEIAAAGGHNIAMTGPPGTGKTMLARSFISLLPPLDFEEMLEVTGIHSAAGILERDKLVTNPPFRAPHHTASYVSLVGGGNWPRPGEITLAHRGVLFLDEFPEFEKRVIESLRQPMEDRKISIARSRGSMIFPASFVLVAAMNPCPCGNKGSKNRECICPPSALNRYQRKISGPIVDRIDLWLEVGQVEYSKLGGAAGEEEDSATVRQRVAQSREIQKHRFAEVPGRHLTKNSEMGPRDLKKFASLNERCLKLLNDSARRLDLSARAYHRIIKLSRTIADLEGGEQIEEQHLLEALQYRPRLTLV